MKYLCSLFSFYILLSCGLRTDEELFSNPISKNWKLESINCFDGDTLKESYLVDDSDEVILNLSGRTFSYTVVENSGVGSACITNAYGSYLLDFDSATLGTLDYSDVITSSGSCGIDTVDQRGSGTHEVAYGFITSDNLIKKVPWSVTGNKLTLRTSTSFKGSSVSGLFCDSSCFCDQVYKTN